MAEEKKKTLRDYIVETENLIPGTKIKQRIFCEKCGVDFFSTVMWNIPNKLVMYKITPSFDVALENPAKQSALERMTKNSAFEPRIASLVNEYVGPENLYFVIHKFQGPRKYQGKLVTKKFAYTFSASGNISHIFLDQQYVYAVDKSTMYEISLPGYFAQQDTVSAFPLNTESLIQGQDLEEYTYTSLANGTHVDIPITHIEKA